MREMMVILGIKGVPRWLQRETRKYLVQQLMQPNGIISILTIVCENPLDYGQHWNKLDTISRLIATSHGINPNEYYKSICSQVHFTNYFCINDSYLFPFEYLIILG